MNARYRKIEQIYVMKHPFTLNSVLFFLCNNFHKEIIVFLTNRKKKRALKNFFASCLFNLLAQVLCFLTVYL